MTGRRRRLLSLRLAEEQPHAGCMARSFCSPALTWAVFHHDPFTPILLPTTAHGSTGAQEMVSSPTVKIGLSALRASPARIVEDMTRLPLVLDKIIEHQGGLVPDFEMQHNGCSKRKRSLKGAESAALRSYQPSPEVAAAMKKRRRVLHQKAKQMCSS